MIEMAELRRRLQSWDLPLGPFREPEDVRSDMHRAADEMGAAAAVDLASLVAIVGHPRAPDGAVLAEFLEIYAEHHPEPLAAALLERLTPQGPPLLVCALGSTASPDAPTRLLATLDLASADDDLLEALACTLGELGDSRAVKGLRDLAARADLSPAVRQEVQIALSNVKPL